MGREIRRVPAGWKAPEHPHYDKDFETACAEWDALKRGWENNPKDGYEFEEYHGERPDDPAFYRPKWTDEERTHLMLYSTTTEGHSYTPALATPEEVARYAADNGVSTFGFQTATYEEWLPMCRGGWAPTLARVGGGPVTSGVKLIADTEINPK